MGFVLRRLSFYATAFLLAISFNFFLPRMMPGDPVDALLAGSMGKMDPSQMDALRATYGFVDGPLWQQYLTYLKSVATWDLGPSILLFPTPVTEVLMFGLPWTLFLAGLALMISVAVGLAAGTYAAFTRGRLFDSIVPPLSMFIGAFPYAVSALALFYFFGLKLQWFPLSYAYDPVKDPGFNADFIGSVALHAALPLLSMVLVGISAWIFNMRNALINVLGEDFITMAEAKGLSRNRVMIRYAARNALLPVTTAVSMAVGFVLAGSIFTEVIFNYPGLGNLMLKAINARDYPVIQAIMLLIVLCMLVANFVADLLMLWLDPRLRR